LKIVQIITHMDTIGGAQVHVSDMCIRLKESGSDVYVIAGGGKNVYEALNEEGILFIYSKNLIRKLNVVSDIKSVLEIRKIVKKINPDIIATHSSKAGIVGRIAGWSLRIPTVFTAHGWSYTDGVSKRKKRFYILIEKVVARISSGVIAVSKYDEALALKHKVLPIRKITTIHNGVHDVEGDLKEQHIYSDDQPNIVMVARFALPKKQLQLLEALNHLQHIKWKICFAGDGPLLKEAQDYVQEMKLSDRVNFLGNCEDVTSLLFKSDLFILISDWEGLPLSILEAMRCGLPIIASDVGGVKEAVIQNENGFLIPKNDFKQLIEKLSYLLTDPLQRLKMGRRGRVIYEENFNFERMYEETLTYYKKVIQTDQEYNNILRRDVI